MLQIKEQVRKKYKRKKAKKEGQVAGALDGASDVTSTLSQGGVQVEIDEVEPESVDPELFRKNPSDLMKYFDGELIK